MLRLLLGAVCAQLADLYLTVYALGSVRGVREGNPIGAALLSHGLLALVLYKLAVAALVVVGACALYMRAPATARRTLVGVNVAMLLLFLWNLANV